MDRTVKTTRADVSLSIWDTCLKPKQPFILPKPCIIDDQTRERDTETHTAFPTVTASCLCERVYECISLCVHVCVCVTKQVGWIPSVISCVNCQRANQKADDDSKAAIGSHSLLSSWQQPLWPTVCLHYVCYLFLVAHNNISYVCVMPSFQVFADATLVFTMNPAARFDT